MRYDDFLTRPAFTKEQLLAFTKGRLVENPPPGFSARLPAPPFLMFDRICQISRDGRTGHVVAEQDIQPDAWYFQCHFEGDPVQPGCLGVDALWQLLGFFAAASGGLGSGRALGCGHVEFMGQIRPYDQRVRYELTVRRFAQLPEQGAAIVIGNGRVLMGDDAIYNVADAKVGLFRDIAFTDYPNPHAAQATGGLIQRT